MNNVKATASLKGCRILIVEDDFLLARYLGKLLEKEGCRIVGLAATVDQALTLVEAEAPDAALLDVNLGGEHTRDVAECLRGRRVPFLLVTGYGEDDLRGQALRQAPRLEKPVQAQELIRELSAMIRPAPPAAQHVRSQPAR